MNWSAAPAHGGNADISGSVIARRSASAAGRERGGKRRFDDGRQARTPERGPQPFAVRRAAALDEQDEPHQVANQPSRDHSRAEIVADLGAASGEGLLLGDAPPLACQHMPPHVVGVPGERRADRRLCRTFWLR